MKGYLVQYNQKLRNTPYFNENQSAYLRNLANSKMNNSRQQNRHSMIQSFGIYQSINPNTMSNRINQTSKSNNNYQEVSQNKDHVNSNQNNNHFTNFRYSQVNQFKLNDKNSNITEQSEAENVQKQIKGFISQYMTEGDQNSQVFKPGIVNIQFLTGSCYIGQILSSLESNINSSIPLQSPSEQQKHGKGVYYFSNGDVYYGQWRDNKFDGHGKYVFNNEQFFIGIWNIGQIVEGQYHYLDGKIYKGQFNKNKGNMEIKPNGYGIMYFTNKRINQNYQNNSYQLSKQYFEGYFVDGLEHGEGRLVNNQFQIKGMWEHGQLIYGRITYLNKNNGKFKDFYQGKFHNNNFHGQGTYHFSSISHYKGSFMHGRFHGNGRLVYQNGQVYEGNFQNGFRWGQGCYYYKNGDTYRGYWQNDKMEGSGQVRFSINKTEGFQNQHQYKGQFNHNQIHGNGTYTWNNFNNSSQKIQFIGQFQKGNLGSGQIYHNSKLICSQLS